MDPYLFAVAARSAERILGVLIGGLAIFYGFRLFLVVPVETQSDGKIKLPGVSVVLAKAGPGLFFAAFGVIVVITSLMNAIKFDDDLVSYQGIISHTTQGARPRSTQATTQGAPSPQDVARIRLAIQTLNCVERLDRQGSGSLSTSDLEVAVRDAKLALLAGVWDADEWGEFNTFRQWASGSVSNISSPAKALFEAQRTDCPR